MAKKRPAESSNAVERASSDYLFFYYLKSDFDCSGDLSADIPKLIRHYERIFITFAYVNSSEVFSGSATSNPVPVLLKVKDCFVGNHSSF